MSGASWDETRRKRAEAILGHGFRDPALLELAFSHPSWSSENDGTRGNERLEFLGDAVLDLVVSELLYEAHPEWAEGDLTRARKTLVNNESLGACARSLGLGELVRLGRGERRAGGAERARLLGNLFEAVVGAIHLDGGLAAATEFLRRCFGSALEAGGALPEHDPKTRFQEWSVGSLGSFPHYETIEDTGVEDDGERFTVEVRVGPEPFGSGSGRTKREAERNAACEALRNAGLDA